MWFRTLRSLVSAFLLLTLSISAPPHAAAQSPAPSDTTKLIQILNSGAGAMEKEDALRSLARVGGPEAIPVLASLLGHENLATLALAALEAMPDPAAGAALRQALTTLKGRNLAGVIDSLGKRRDTLAESALQPLLTDPDDDVATAAAAALGKMGNEQTAAALVTAMGNAPKLRKAALADACLNCADNLAAQKKLAQALPIYERLRQADLPERIRRPAALSLIQGRGEAAIPLVAECLASTEWDQVELGLQGSRIVPGPEMTRALLGALAKAPAATQCLIVRALGDRQDGQILPAMTAAATQGEPSVRVEALRVIGRQGDAAQAPFLFKLAADPQPDVAAAARTVLTEIPGRAMDEAVVAGLGAATPGERLLALQVAAKRRISSANPALLKLAADPDRKVRLAALRMLSDVGGRAEAQALLARMMKPENAADLGALEAALRTLGTRRGEPQKCTAELLGALAGAAGPQRGAVLRLLAATATPEGLRALREAVNDPDATVREAAFRTLCEWPAADAAEGLLAMAKAATDPTRRILALRGALRLAGLKEVAPARKLALIVEAVPLAKSEDEKKMLLGLMQGVFNPRVLTLAAGYLDDPATKEEAAQAAVTIAERLSAPPRTPQKARPAVDKAVRDAMSKVLGANPNEELRQRAQAVLERVK